jgi:ribA/ribD-fused uncharacterized protein
MMPLEIFAIYFSAFSPHVIEYKGVVYPTVEHAYHCLRYSDPAIVAEILAARSPYEAWKISQTYKRARMPHFTADDAKIALMTDVMRAKLEQHEDVRQALLASGDQQIVKRITTGPPGDGFWDDGGDGRGANHVGRIWMQLRPELLRSEMAA